MRTGHTTRRLVTRLNSLILVGVFIILATIVALPFYSVATSAKTSRVSPLTASLSPTRSSWASTFRSFLPIPASETINTFAGDCTTPRSTFFVGETVCAKTDNVDLNYPGGRWVDWILTGNQTTIVSGSRTTTLITTNPQTFTYAPNTAGVYKVEITQDLSGQDDPQTPAVFTVVDAPPIATYDSTCKMARTTFVLGETVCAKATGLVGYRFAWVDAAGYIEKRTDITTDPQTDTFPLPSTQTSVINITPDNPAGVTVDNRGEWRVNAITSRGSLKTSAFFTVKDPAHAVVDLSIVKTLVGGNNPVEGGPVQFSVTITNNGPDDAANAHFVDDTFTNATFNAVTQPEGLPFTCTGSSSADCTIAVFPKGSVAKFLLNFTAGTAGGNLQNTATVSSSTAEQNSLDNSFTTETFRVGSSGGTPPTCLLGCPENMNANADTTEGGQRGTHVSYPDPTTSGTCGTISYDHLSGSFFPDGSTTVTATSTQGNGSCSFTVTVFESGNAPTITCPSDKTANADNNCVATVAVGTATFSGGQNVTLFATRSDGKPMYTCDVNPGPDGIIGTSDDSTNGNCTRRSSDDPFSAGTTAITWYAYSHDVAGPYTTSGPNPGDTFEEQHRTGTASCTQTVTVNDVTPPVITATDSTVAADANCQAAVPDYSNSVTDNCSCAANDNSQDCVGQHRITTTQDVPAGTMLGPGSYTIHVTANDGSSNPNPGPDGIFGTSDDGTGNISQKDITLTVADQTPPTIHCPANIITNTDPGMCSAVVNPGTATATDNCDSNPTVAGTRSDNQPLNAPYPKGTTTITWTATDHASPNPPNQSSCMQTVTVQDHEPPTITTNGLTPILWPANHNYHTYNVTDFVTAVSDNCGGVSVSNVVIQKVTSDEAVNGPGSGNTFNDIIIASNCKSVQLRAERENAGDGRVYTITFKLTDTSGNVTTKTSQVQVPKNLGVPVVDSGPHYTVNGTCP